MKFFGGQKADRAEAERLDELSRKMEAISRSQAVIEFELDGTIITANENFLKATGYGAAEIVGRHHSTFMDPTEAAGTAYKDFCRELNQGRFMAEKFRRMAKGGRELWLQATYNPVLRADGRPYKVIKFAIDITEAEQASALREVARREAEAAQGRL